MPNIFDKLPLDAYRFSRMSPRERMVAQLSGMGLGSNGLEGVIHTNGGQVGYLAGMGLPGMLPPIDPRANDTMTGPDGAMQSGAMQQGAMQYQPKSGAAVTPTFATLRTVQETNFTTRRTINSLPTSRTVTTTAPDEVKLVPLPGRSSQMPSADGGIPQFPTGMETPQGDVQEFSDRRNDPMTWDGDAPHGEPLRVDLHVDTEGNGPPPQTQQQMVQVASSGIPTWLKVAGGVAAAAIAYKLFKGKRR